MKLQPLQPKDANALDSMTPETQAVLYFALKALRNEVIRTSTALMQHKKMTPELLEYYTKIELHTQSLQMVLDANTQTHTLANL